MYYSGKLELTCKNKIDKSVYSITIVDPELYKGVFMNYIYALSAIRDGNPYVCKYFCSWKEQGLIFLQTEKCDKTLSNLFSKASPTDKEILKMITEVMSGIEYCHRKGLANFDISMESIFISETQHYKFKGMENCAKKEMDTFNSQQVKEFSKMKAKDIDDFCLVINSLFDSKNLLSKIDEHSEILEAMYNMLDDESSLAEFPLEI